MSYSRGVFLTQAYEPSSLDFLESLALAGGFFTTAPPGKPQRRKELDEIEWVSVLVIRITWGVFKTTDATSLQRNAFWYLLLRG